MAADVQSGAALAGRSYIDPSANPRSGSCNDPIADIADSKFVSQKLPFDWT